MQAMEPNPAFDPESYPDVIEAFDALGSDAKILIWGGDWCKDTRQELPDFAALLEATSLDPDQIEAYEVDQDKEGPEVAAYDVERFPTIVVEGADGVVAHAEVPDEEKGVAIGTGGRNVSVARRLATRHFDIDDVRIE